jgi:hypothetical protein
MKILRDEDKLKYSPAVCSREDYAWFPYLCFSQIERGIQSKILLDFGTVGERV